MRCHRDRLGPRGAGEGWTREKVVPRRPVYAARFPKCAKPVGSSRRVSRFPRFSPGHAILHNRWTEHFSPRFLETNEIRFHADPSSMLIVRPFSHACKDGIELRPPAIKRYDIAPIYYLKRTPVRNNTSVKSVICISLQMYSVYQLAGTLVKRVFLSLSLSFPYPS